MSANELIVFLVSLALSFVFTRLLRDQLKKRQVIPAEIPKFGGIVIFLAFLLTLMLSAWISQQGLFKTQLLVLLAGSFLVLLIGIYDDLKGASVTSRLAVEIGAACLVYFAGVGIHSIPNPFGLPLALGWLSLPVTVIWVVVITNAINLIDGLDGLAAGTSILILATIVLLNWQVMPEGFFLAAFALIGALLGFLAYNFPPASIYMGDSGSLFLGFFLSTFTIAVSSGTSGSSSMRVTILAFSIPLLDMLYAVLRRWYRGVPIYKADRDHLHHKLLQKGLTKGKVVLLFYAANLALLLALVLAIRIRLPRSLMVMALLLLSIAAFAGFQLLSDLKLLDFSGKVLALFRGFRKRRYHLYLINRFEHQVEKKKKFAEITVYLDELFKEYGFCSVTIHCSGGLAYHFNSGAKEDDSYRLQFPILNDGVRHGVVELQKGVGDGYLYCSGELAETLSRHLGKLITGR